MIIQKEKKRKKKASEMQKCDLYFILILYKYISKEVIINVYYIIMYKIIGTLVSLVLVEIIISFVHYFTKLLVNGKMQSNIL